MTQGENEKSMSKRETWKKKIKELLARGKMTEKALRKSVGIEEKKKFHQVLDELVEEGAVRVNREHVVELIQPGDKKEGVIVSLSRGFAFARVQEMDQDLFIHCSNLNGALLGDKVEILPMLHDPKGPSGRVVRILEKKGFRSAVIEAMRACADVSRRL